MFLWSFCFVIDFIGWLFNCQSSVVLMAVIDRLIYDIWRILNLSDHWEIFQIIPEKVPAADPWIWPTVSWSTVRSQILKLKFRNLLLFSFYCFVFFVLYLNFFLFCVCVFVFSHCELCCYLMFFVPLLCFYFVVLFFVLNLFCLISESKRECMNIYLMCLFCPSFSLFFKAMDPCWLLFNEKVFIKYKQVFCESVESSVYWFSWDTISKHLFLRQ